MIKWIYYTVTDVLGRKTNHKAEGAELERLLGKMSANDRYDLEHGGLRSIPKEIKRLSMKITGVATENERT